MKLAVLIVILNTLLLNAQVSSTAAQPAMRKDADGCSLLVPESLGRPVAVFVDEGQTVSKTDAVGPVLHFRDATPLPLNSMSEGLQNPR